MPDDIEFTSSAVVVFSSTTGNVTTQDLMKCVSVVAVDDSLVENTESVMVRIDSDSIPDSANVAVVAGQVQIFITDNDDGTVC